MGRKGLAARADGGADAYLLAVERRAGLVLSQAEADAVVLETRARLEASVRARLELGDAAPVAEVGAILALGLPGSELREALARHRARFRPLFLAGTLASGLGFASAASQASALGLEPSFVTGVAFLSTLAALMASRRGDRRS